jgi:hypothetical protein
VAGVELPVAAAFGAAASLDTTDGADAVRTGAEPVEEADVVRGRTGCARKEPRLDATAPRLDRPCGVAPGVGVLEPAAGEALAVGVALVPATEVALALAVGVGQAEALPLRSMADRIGLLRST